MHKDDFTEGSEKGRKVNEVDVKKPRKASKDLGQSDEKEKDRNFDRHSP